MKRWSFLSDIEALGDSPVLKQLIAELRDVEEHEDYLRNSFGVGNIAIEGIGMRSGNCVEPQDEEEDESKVDPTETSLQDFTIASIPHVKNSTSHARIASTPKDVCSGGRKPTFSVFSNELSYESSNTGGSILRKRQVSRTEFSDADSARDKSPKPSAERIVAAPMVLQKKPSTSLLETSHINSSAHDSWYAKMTPVEAAAPISKIMESRTRSSFPTEYEVRMKTLISNLNKLPEKSKNGIVTLTREIAEQGLVFGDKQSQMKNFEKRFLAETYPYALETENIRIMNANIFLTRFCVFSFFILSSLGIYLWPVYTSNYLTVVSTMAETFSKAFGNFIPGMFALFRTILTLLDELNFPTRIPFLISAAFASFEFIARAWRKFGSKLKIVGGSESVLRSTWDNNTTLEERLARAESDKKRHILAFKALITETLLLAYDTDSECKALVLEKLNGSVSKMSQTNKSKQVSYSDECYMNFAGAQSRVVQADNRVRIEKAIQKIQEQELPLLVGNDFVDTVYGTARVLMIEFGIQHQNEKRKENERRKTGNASTFTIQGGRAALKRRNTLGFDIDVSYYTGDEGSNIVRGANGAAEPRRMTKQKMKRRMLIEGDALRLAIVDQFEACLRKKAGQESSERTRDSEETHSHDSDEDGSDGDGSVHASDDVTDPDADDESLHVSLDRRDSVTQPQDIESQQTTQEVHRKAVMQIAKKLTKSICREADVSGVTLAVKVFKKLLPRIPSETFNSPDTANLNGEQVGVLSGEPKRQEISKLNALGMDALGGGLLNLRTNLDLASIQNCTSDGGETRDWEKVLSTNSSGIMLALALYRTHFTFDRLIAEFMSIRGAVHFVLQYRRIFSNNLIVLI